MKTICRKWKPLIYGLGLVMMTNATAIAVPLPTAAAETTAQSNITTLITTVGAYQPITTRQMNAGVAVLIDADFSMNEEQLTALIDAKTADIETVAAIDEQESSTLVMAKVNEYVNIRSEASQESDKVGLLYKDCGGYIIERKDGWTKLTSGDVTGWVKDEYLYFGDEAQQEAQEVGVFTAYSTTETLRVRKEPSLEAGVLGLLAEGEAVEAIEEQGDWVCVSYEGETAYVSAQYVTTELDIDTAESIEEIEAREAAEKAEAEAAAQAAAERDAKRKQLKEAVIASASEVNILAALVQCEAGGESYEGQLAVASVVMNRVRCAAYPDTIVDVIYASGQFTPATSTKMNELALNGTAKASCIQAAQEAISGVTNVGDALHFRRAGKHDGIVIGNHVFW